MQILFVMERDLLLAAGRRAATETPRFGLFKLPTACCLRVQRTHKSIRSSDLKIKSE